jgi:hypothetical protein
MKIDYDSLDPIAEFDIKIKGELTKNTYLGTFKVKCLLTAMEMIDVDRKYREFIGKEITVANEQARNLAFALAQLNYRIIECPPFWENKTIGGGHIKDSNVILEVLEKAFEAQFKYSDHQQEQADKLEKKLTESIKKGEIQKEEINNG